MLLRKKIPITIISLVTIPLIILSIIVYTYTSRALIETNKTRIKNISQIESENLNNIISSHTRQLELTARMGEIVDLFILDDNNMLADNDWMVRETANHALETTLAESKELDNAFAANLEGKVILSGRKEFLKSNISSKQYFADALSGKTVISNIIQDSDEGKKVVVIATPIHNEKDKVIGVLGHTLSVEYFKNKIANIKMSNQGYAYIVDAEGIILAHPDRERIGTRIENDVIYNIVKGIKNDEMPLAGEGTYFYRGKHKYMAYSVLPQINWVIVFAQNQTEMNEAARIVFILISLTTLGFVILSLAMSVEVSKSITEPIDQLIGTMDKAAEGDLTSKCEIESENEFGKLANNFNAMLSQLSSSYDELNSVYNQLSAAEEELRAQYDELQKSGDELRKSEEKYKLAIEGANDIIWEWDLEKKIFYVSDKWSDIVGGEPIQNLPFDKFTKLIYKKDVRKVIKKMKKHINRHTEFYKSEFRIRSENGELIWLLARGKALRNKEGKVIKVAGSMTDITERKAIENKIKDMAYYDALTKLPNRILFMEKLETELKRAKEQYTFGAVMLVDLDNFKNINDTLGHDYGDKLLKAIADELRLIITDNNMVCRFGGDEFLVLIPDVGSEREVTDFTKNILSIFEDPFIINDKLTYITASIGICIYPKDAEDTGTILKNADVAMYTAKSLGKNMFLFFDDEMSSGLERKLKIEAILREALLNNSFELYYQPQIDVKYNKIIGFEALLRLNSKELGFISPAEFIPIAEETGIIKEIGAWCLKTACMKNKEWRDKGYDFESIAVNISTVQFQQNNFIEIVTNILEETKLEPEFLEIEITESVLIRSLEKNIEILERLREIGVKIALDDFGTGYSSFNYLRMLPINTLKIDKSFIDGICSGPKEEAIAYGMIQLAHQMELEVVAEGVEDEKQLEVLQAKECDKVQGYLFSKPLPAYAAEQLIVNF